MTKLQEILALQKQLPDRTEEIEAMKYHAIDEEWQAHHAATAIISDTIGDYQVMRKFDIEIDFYMDWEERVLEKMSEKQRLKYLPKGSDDIDLDSLYEDYDFYENAYSFEIGEYMQIWYNVKDRSVFMLGKIDKDPFYCNFESKWTCLSGKKTYRVNKFLEHFGSLTAEDGFYRDASVHTDLVNAGYQTFDTYDWTYEYIDKSSRADVRFVNKVNIADLYDNFLYKKTAMVTLINLYGKDAYLYVQSIQDEDKRKEIIAAFRIARRNKYQPADTQTWLDHIDMLYKLGKDLHNAHYVCPKDLQREHQKLIDYYNRYERRIRLQNDMRQAEQTLEQFIEHMQAFLDLHFETKNIVLRPLRSPMEYIEEGTAMHHCVAGYKNKYDSLILSARDHQDNRIATCEVSLQDYRIIQIRGLQNKPTEYDDEIAICLTKNMAKIRKANKIQKQLIAAKAA